MGSSSPNFGGWKFQKIFDLPPSSLVPYYAFAPENNLSLFCPLTIFFRVPRGPDRSSSITPAGSRGATWTSQLWRDGGDQEGNAYPTNLTGKQTLYPPLTNIAPENHWLMVSTRWKNISQIGSFPQVGVKIKNIWKYLKPPSRSIRKNPAAPTCFCNSEAKQLKNIDDTNHGSLNHPTLWLLLGATKTHETRQQLVQGGPLDGVMGCVYLFLAENQLVTGVFSQPT